MTDVFRILDRFKITGRGTVYTVKNYSHSNIRIGDILYDLQSNRFKVKGIEMFRRIPNGMDIEDMPLGLMFELMDGAEAEGNMLVRSLEDVSFIFCNHPLYPKRVDEDYEEEFQAAGLEHACALFSYENIEMGKLSLYGEDISGLTIYRGWMMKPELYRSFYNKLEAKGIILINTPEEYNIYHMLPGWYDDYKEDTAKSVWEDQGTVDSALLLARNLEGAYLVKDYVKSRKHEWYDACFTNNIADKKNAERIIKNFVERQGSDLVGGVVLRQFEKLKSIGFHEKSGMPISEEYRVFVFAGRVMIMELGDGQVSGLQQIKANDFYRAFNPDVLRMPDELIEDAIPEGAVILAGDPMPDMSVEKMQQIISSIATTQELVNAYVNVHNKFWFIEDDLYDYDEGTAEYERVRSIVDAWGDMMDELDKRVMDTAAAEGLLAERQPNSGTVKQLEAFMDKYGYRDGCGWWVQKKEPDA